MEIKKFKTCFWELQDQITKTFGDVDGAAFVGGEWAKSLDNPEYQIDRFFSSGYKISYHDNNF